MPDIPTSDEGGVPGLYMSGWFGFFAPTAGRPPRARRRGGCLADCRKAHPIGHKTPASANSRRGHTDLGFVLPKITTQVVSHKRLQPPICIHRNTFGRLCQKPNGKSAV
jgi:hypothetical protein